MEWSTRLLDARLSVFIFRPFINSSCYQLYLKFLFVIFASFSQGNLVCNHLPNDDLIDSMVFCKHHCLLAMTEAQRVDEVVVWKEVSIFSSPSQYDAIVRTHPYLLWSEKCIEFAAHQRDHLSA